MGCGGSVEIVDKKEAVFDSVISSNVFSKLGKNSNQDLMNILYLKIFKLIKKNPFYIIPLSEFETTFNLLLREIGNEKDYDIEITIDGIISRYFINQKTFIKTLFKDVVLNAFSKFSFILQENNDLIELILYFLYIFLSDEQPGKKKLFKEKMALLLNMAKMDNKKENEYKMSTFFNILLNLVQMFSFSFACFFVFFTFLDNFGDYNEKKFEEIFKEKNFMINDVKTIIDNNLNDINKNISPYFLNLLVLSEINNKINFLFQKGGENDEFIILEDYEIDKISDSIFNIISINNYVEYLFFGDNHDY